MLNKVLIMKQKLYSFIQRGLFAKTLVVMLFAFAATGYAQTSSGTWGGIDWTLTEDGTLTISPTKGEPVPDKNYPEYTYEVGQWREAVVYKTNGDASAIGGAPYDHNKVKKLIIEEGVTSIGSFTAKFPKLTGEVVIPWTVNYFGQESFQGATCSKLTFQKVPAGKTGGKLCVAAGAFKNLIVEEFSFPDDRPVELHCWTLVNCKKLKHLTYPATITGFLGYNHVDYFQDPDAYGAASYDTQQLRGNDNLLSITFGSEEVKTAYSKTFNSKSEGFYTDDPKEWVGLTRYITSRTGPITNVTEGNASFEQTEDGTQGVVVYTRNLLPAGTWNALYVPFEIPVSALGDDYDVAYFNNMHAYDKDYNGTIDEMDMEIILIEEGTLRAHHPYFIRAKNKAAEDMSLAIFNSKVLSTMNEDHTAIKTSSAYLDFTLTGTYDTMTEENFNAIDGKNYAISTKGSWNRTKGIKPFRLYLNIKERPGSPVKVDEQNARVRMRVVGKEEATAIDEVEMPVSIEQPTAIYDLQGRRVLNTEGLKGIYIVNGKKVAF